MTLFGLIQGLLSLVASLMKIRYDVTEEGREKRDFAKFLKWATWVIGCFAVVVVTGAVLTYKPNFIGEASPPGNDVVGEDLPHEDAPPASEKQQQPEPKNVNPPRKPKSASLGRERRGEASTPSARKRAAKDRRAVEGVVRKAQMFEFLELFLTPGEYGDDAIDRYWSGEAAMSVRKVLDWLTENEWHYSAQSALQMFVVKTIGISRDRLQAEVRTQEEWYLPIEDAMGNDVEVEGQGPNWGPFAVSYILRRKTLKSPWKIVRTTSHYTRSLSE